MNPDVKSEVDTWHDNFCFIMRVVPDGPMMVMRKTGGRLIYYRGMDAPVEDIAVCLKNIEFVFRMMTGLFSNSEVVCQNRQYVIGDLIMMMSIL